MKYLLPDEILDRLGAPDDELLATLQGRLDDHDTFPLAVKALDRLPASRTTLDLFRRWDALEPPLTEVERLTRMVRVAAEDPTLGAEVGLDIAISKEAGAVDAAIREAARCAGPGAVRLAQRLCDGPDDLRDRALAALARLRAVGALPASLASIVPSAGQ